MAETPTKYLRFNEQNTKNISLVVEIPGIDLLSNRPIYKRVRYGDPDLTYGEPGLVYGGLREIDGVRDILSLESSSLSLSQKLEPEQGRGAISVLSLAFIDANQYMTQVCSPGVILDDILGKPVTIWLGFQEISFKEDYLQIFKGKVTGVDALEGKIILQLSDPNVNRKSKIFYTAKTTLATSIEYESNTFQNLIYRALPPNGTNISIAYTGGGTAGSEVVTTVSTAISVQIQNGVSTAAQIKSAIDNHNAARALVTVETFGNENTPQTTMAATFLATDHTIPVVSNGDFHQSVLGPNGAYDPAIKLYLKVENEFIEYGPSFSNPSGGFGVNTFTSTLRAERGTIGERHEAGADVTACIEISDHMVDMALKLMLSGWAGPWAEDKSIQHIVFTGDPDLGDQPSAIIFPSGIDPKRDYGAVEGDYVTITGATNGVNNQTATIVRFADLFGEFNRIMYLDTGTLVHEEDSPALLSFRSQYDTYPVSCGMALPSDFVDIERHLSIKSTFLGSSQFSLRFLIQEESSGKTFLETELYLPFSCYSLTRRGRMSMGITKPPIAETTLLFLTVDNVKNPEAIKVSRNVNSNRKFFNNIQYQYDYTDEGESTKTLSYLDTDSLNIIGFSSSLPIKSKGARTDLGFDDIAEKNARFFLGRYKNAASVIDIQVFYELANQIEAGDVVALRDDDVSPLQITNFETGERGIGLQLYEVLDRPLNIKDGSANLKLVSGVGSMATDRFGTVSPSSLTDTGSTSSAIKIKDSFGAIFPGDEPRKWRQYIGQKIIVHNVSRSVSEETTFVSFNGANQYILNVSPALSFTPPADYIVDIPDYPHTSTDPYENILYKSIHAFFDPQIPVATGVSPTQFTVSSGFTVHFFVGGMVRVHNDSYSIDSGDRKIIDVDVGTNTITVSESFGFTPASGQFVDLIGFRDRGGAYRLI